MGEKTVDPNSIQQSPPVEYNKRYRILVPIERDDLISAYVATKQTVAQQNEIIGKLQANLSYWKDKYRIITRGEGIVHDDDFD